jgi:hypothetical protein
MIADMYETAGVPRTLDGNLGNTLGYSELATSTFNGKRKWSASCCLPGPNIMLWTSTPQGANFSSKESKLYVLKS